MSTFDTVQAACDEIDRGFSRRLLGRWFWRTKTGKARRLLSEALVELQPGMSPPASGRETT